jgi:glycosyltransferase involved in cell wall biosynthesis
VGRHAESPCGHTLSNDGVELSEALVTILLCTYNGEHFLQQQLESISGQSHHTWRLIISDDASCDATLSILANYKAQRANGQVEIRVQTKRQGAVANFMSLLTDGVLKSDYFACCDQDDVWWPAKLERALRLLASGPTERPAVYFSRTRNVDVGVKPIGFSPLFRRPAGFRNALVQSIGGANTMVFNRAAHKLLVAAGPVVVASHDWWTYLLISGAGGIVHYDPSPSMDYRQHGNNVIGANRGTRARIKRARMVAAGQLTTWLDLHVAAVAKCQPLLSKENRELFEHFCAMRSGPLRQRLAGWKRLRPYRQSRIAQFAMLLTLLANRL